MLHTHILAKITITWPIVRQQICELHLIIVKDVCMWQQIDALTHASKYKATNGSKIQQHMIMDFWASHYGLDNIMYVFTYACDVYHILSHNVPSYLDKQEYC